MGFPFRNLLSMSIILTLRSLDLELQSSAQRGDIIIYLRIHTYIHIVLSTVTLLWQKPSWWRGAMLLCLIHTYIHTYCARIQQSQFFPLLLSGPLHTLLRWNHTWSAVAALIRGLGNGQEDQVPLESRGHRTWHLHYKHMAALFICWYSHLQEHLLLGKNLFILLF